MLLRAVAGCAVSSLWFLPAVLARRDVIGFPLFVAAAGAASAVAGALGGAALCDRHKTPATRHAVFRGVGIATLALGLFAPLFAVLHGWTARGETRLIGLSIAALAFTFLATW